LTTVEQPTNNHGSDSRAQTLYQTSLLEQPHDPAWSANPVKFTQRANDYRNEPTLRGPQQRTPYDVSTYPSDSLTRMSNILQSQVQPSPQFQQEALAKLGEEMLQQVLGKLKTIVRTIVREEMSRLEMHVPRANLAADRPSDPINQENQQRFASERGSITNIQNPEATSGSTGSMVGEILKQHVTAPQPRLGSLPSLTTGTTGARPAGTIQQRTMERRQSHDHQNARKNAHFLESAALETGRTENFDHRSRVSPSITSQAHLRSLLGKRAREGSEPSVEDAAESDSRAGMKTTI